MTVLAPPTTPSPLAHASGQAWCPGSRQESGLDIALARQIGDGDGRQCRLVLSEWGTREEERARLQLEVEYLEADY